MEIIEDKNQQFIRENRWNQHLILKRAIESVDL